MSNRVYQEHADLSEHAGGRDLGRLVELSHPACSERPDARLRAFERFVGAWEMGSALVAVSTMAMSSSERPAWGARGAGRARNSSLPSPTD